MQNTFNPGSNHSKSRLSNLSGPGQSGPDRANLNWLTRVFIWLSGAGEESLRSCPNWEQRKYVAFGSAVLVPTLFALMAASYAVSTLTNNPWIIISVALIWSFIVLTIDRTLLATYRAFQGWERKITQFALRLGVAILMGLTISHPLTLLLFKDTITMQIEAGRDSEIKALRNDFDTARKDLDERIGLAEAAIDKNREDYRKSFEADFIEEDPNAGLDDPAFKLDGEAREVMNAEIAETIAPNVAALAEIDTQMAEVRDDQAKLQDEINHWQQEFEREINGQRSGIVGVGPRARSIREDQMQWRLVEADRLGTLLADLTNRKLELENAVGSAKRTIQNRFAETANLRATKIIEDRERVSSLRNRIQEQQMEVFVDRQDAVRTQIQEQIDTGLGDLKRLQGESGQLSLEERELVASIRAQPRRDILTQTLALHGLFKNGQEGGHFALAAYLVLAALFMLVDVIPLVVKSFSKPGPYDMMVDYDETRFGALRTVATEPYSEVSNRLVVRNPREFARCNNLLEVVNHLENIPQPARKIEVIESTAGQDSETMSSRKLDHHPVPGEPEIHC